MEGVIQSTPYVFVCVMNYTRLARVSRMCMYCTCAHSIRYLLAISCSLQGLLYRLLNYREVWPLACSTQRSVGCCARWLKGPTWAKSPQTLPAERVALIMRLALVGPYDYLFGRCPISFRLHFHLKFQASMAVFPFGTALP